MGASKGQREDAVAILLLVEVGDGGPKLGHWDTGVKERERARKSGRGTSAPLLHLLCCFRARLLRASGRTTRPTTWEAAAWTSRPGSSCDPRTEGLAVESCGARCSPQPPVTINPRAQGVFRRRARADFGVKLFRFSRSPGLSVQVASAWRF